MNSKAEGTIPNLFYEAIITSEPKPDKRIKGKKTQRSNFSQTDAKLFNKITVNQF